MNPSLDLVKEIWKVGGDGILFLIHTIRHRKIESIRVGASDFAGLISVLQFGKSIVCAFIRVNLVWVQKTW